MIVTPRQGVVAADISLPVVSRECGEAGLRLMSDSKAPKLHLKSLNPEAPNAAQAQAAKP